MVEHVAVSMWVQRCRCLLPDVEHHARAPSVSLVRAPRRLVPLKVVEFIEALQPRVWIVRKSSFETSSATSSEDGLLKTLMKNDADLDTAVDSSTCDYDICLEGVSTSVLLIRE